MKIPNPFRRHRRRQAQQQAAAIRAKARSARQQLADTDAMLASRAEQRS